MNWSSQIALVAGTYDPVLVVLTVVATAYLLSYLLLKWLSGRYGFVTGMPYVVLGALLVPVMGWLPVEVMEGFDPLVGLATGAVALAAGLGVDAAKFGEQRGTTLKLGLTVTAVTLAVVVGVPWLVLQYLWEPPMNSALWLPVLGLLGAMGLVADSRPVEALAKYMNLEGEVAVEKAMKVAWVSTLGAVVFLGVVFSLYNPGPQWAGPVANGALWLGVQIVTGVVLGVVGGALVEMRPEDDRLLTVLLGVLVTASMAAYVTTMSIVFVNFVAGVVLINMSSESLRVRGMLEGAMGPLYVLLLFFLGTLWVVETLPAWLYVAVGIYVGLRVVGRYLGAAAYRPKLSGYRPEPGMYRAWIAPGALTAALVLDFSFAFGDQPEMATMISALVLVVVAEELVSFALVRGWLIESADVETMGSSKRRRDRWRAGR